MQTIDDPKLVSNPNDTYSKKRTSFIEILQNNPPAKNKKNELHSYCIRSNKYFAPKFPKDLEEKKEAMRFLDLLIDFINAKIKLDKAIEDYNANINPKNLREFTTANNEYIEKIKLYHQEYQAVISTNNRYIEINTSLALFIIASFVALEISVVLGAGLFALVPGVAIPLAFLMIGLIGDTKSFKYSYVLRAVTKTYNDTYKDNITLFSASQNKPQTGDDKQPGSSVPDSLTSKGADYTY